VATDFAGKTALITGAGRGIGRAVALGLGDAGAHVVLLARTAAQLDETRALLRARGVPAQRVRVLPADLADEEQRAHAAAAVLTSGRVDILVNNAATVEPLGPTAGIKAEDLHRHAGLDPPAGPGTHRRWPARAVQPELRRGLPDHPGALRRGATRPPGRR
jgi:NAD(P)-dependent dehydrogenase (short-subunit alcohol dehydrogenase family)